MELKWQINDVKGVSELKEVTRIGVTVDGSLKKAEAVMKFAVADKMFFNGYQTWTWCPEYTVKDHIRGLGKLPKGLVDRFALDRYGDYHFVEYPEKKGKFHGFSYCYFRNGGTYRLLASLNEENGYTIFRYDASKQEMTITRDCEGLLVNGEFAAFELYYKEGSEKEVFDGWFKAMGIKPVTTCKQFGYSSWYNRYENINEEGILADLEGCKRILKEGDLFQVDDGWEPNVGDWLEPDEAKFPSGMKKIADRIHENGWKAGIWLAPFVCNVNSAVARQHPDWLLQHQGKPWINGSNWGGFYSLDLDRPAVREYIEKVFDRVFNEWGFDLVKLDFLYAGAPFGDENRTRAGKMTDAMKWLRKLCGNKQILGCGVPLMPSFGLVDYCRIGCDVTLDWNDKLMMRGIHRERTSTTHSMDNTFFRRQLNGRAFLSDPDVFFIRDNNIKLTEKEKESLYTMNALFGGILLTSDNPQLYDEEKIRKLEEVRKLFLQAKITKIKNDGAVFLADGKEGSVSLKRPARK